MSKDSTSGADKPEESYYGYFDDKTRSGKVFIPDSLSAVSVPTKLLTEEEKKQRDNWERTFKDLEDHYFDQEDVFERSPKVTTREELLQQRLVPPVLAQEYTSSRSTPAQPRKGRRYPPKIETWSDFEEEVKKYKPYPDDDTVKLRPKKNELFLDCFRNISPRPRYNEAGEHEWLISCFWYLEKAGVCKLVEGSLPGMMGQCDLCWTCPGENNNEKDKCTVIIEVKSTHNLLLPEDCTNVVQSYSDAYDAADNQARNHPEQDQSRPPKWSQVAHPLGQLIGYLVDNKHRYGALTSATRTYFVFISGEGNDANVRVSSAWYVGQRNYLRAWMYMHFLGSNSESSKISILPSSWIRTDKGNTPDEFRKKRNWSESKMHDSDNQQFSSGSRGGTVADEQNALSGVLPSADFQSLEILGLLGHGKNGACFKAKWNQQLVALKQFDTNKDGMECFHQEIEAYMRLKDAWGRLVPSPLFVSESWSGGIIFLGLQLGRIPEGDEDLSQLENVLQEIRAKYGISLNDIDSQNVVFLLSKDGSKERLAAIDLEDYEIVDEPRE